MRSRQQRSSIKSEPQTVNWEPKTRLGKLIKSGQINNMSDALKSGLPLR